MEMPQGRNDVMGNSGSGWESKPQEPPKVEIPLVMGLLKLQVYHKTERSFECNSDLQ